MAAVISGQFSVNSRLPPEVKLAQQIGVSRPVLRTALIRLRTDGIFASKRGSGNYVIRQPHQSVLQMVQLSQIVDIQNCFKYRVGLEGESAYYAAMSKDRNALQQIGKAPSILQIPLRRGCCRTLHPLQIGTGAEVLSIPGQHDDLVILL